MPRGFDIAEELDRDGFQSLAIEMAHAAGLVSLPSRHRDPFDRMLIAQAITERLTVVTADPHFAAYGVELR